MHPLLAASADSTAATASDIGNWVLVLFALLTGVSTLLQVVAFFRPRPANHEVFASKDELEKVEAHFTEENKLLHARISGLRDELGKQISASREASDMGRERIISEISSLRGEFRQEVHGINNRLDETRRAVSRIEGATERTR